MIGRFGSRIASMVALRVSAAGRVTTSALLRNDSATVCGSLAGSAQARAFAFAISRVSSRSDAGPVHARRTERVIRPVGERDAGRDARGWTDVAGWLSVDGEVAAAVSDRR